MVNISKLHHASESIKSAVVNDQQLTLIAKGTNCEVMIQEVKSGDIFCISQDDFKTDIFEFLYILNGEVMYLPNDGSVEKQTFKNGDYFYFSNSLSTYMFEVIDDVKLLYFTSVPVFESLDQEFSHLIDLVKKVEEKDIYTKEHSSRVCDISVKLANFLQLNSKTIEQIYYASVFHDVGKLNIDSKILTKPGKLTKEEYDIIKTHSAESSMIIGSIDGDAIADIVLQHHERLDGSGYPNGLLGDQIRIEARIIAVADTFDAMTSTRAYREALSIEVAIEELVTFKNKHYDPIIVDALIELLGKKIIT